MPLYEYKCRDCGGFEQVVEKYDANPSKRCSKCGGLAVRIFSVPAIPQFRGVVCSSSTAKNRAKAEKD